MPESRRILVVGEQWFGATPRGVASGFRALGHEVETVDPLDTILQPSGVVLKAVRRALMPILVADYNRKLRDVAAQFRPEVVVVVKGPHLLPNTLRAIKAGGARLYNYYPDVSVFAFGKHIPNAMPEYDHVFTTKSFQVDRLREWLGADRVTFLPHGYSDEVHRVLELTAADRAAYTTDVGYIGNYSPHKESWLADLRARLPELQFSVRGNFWAERCQRPELNGCVASEAIHGWGYAKVIRAAKINVAVHYGAVDGDADLMSTRSFEIPACGGFMLHERNAETESFFVEDAEAALFGDVDEAAEKVRYYLANETERIRVRDAGRARAVPAYSYTARMAELLAHHDVMTEACPA